MKRGVIPFLFSLLVILSCSGNGDKDMNNPRFPVPPFMGEAGNARIVPPNTLPNKGSWSVNGNLICLNPDVTQSMQIDFPEPGAYTIQFNKITPPAAGPNGIWAQATIQWKVAGNMYQRIISLTPGASITGVADGVIVTIRDVSTTPALAGIQYAVSATVSKGTRANTQNPPVLYAPDQGVTIIAPGAVQQFNMPQNAGVQSVQVTIASGAVPPVPIPDQEVIVSQVSGPVTFKAYDPRAFDWVTVAQGMFAIVVANSAGAPANIAVSVTWGIDG